MLAYRQFTRADLRGLALLMSGIVLASVLLSALLVIAWPQSATPRLLTIGSISSLRMGAVTRIEVPTREDGTLPDIVLHDPANPAVILKRLPNPFKGTAPVPIYLIPESPTTMFAVYGRDLHSTCLIPWQYTAKEFIDPCYGSAYTIAGAHKHGPARTGLVRFPVEITSSGEIKLDVRGGHHIGRQP